LAFPQKKLLPLQRFLLRYAYGVFHIFIGVCGLFRAEGVRIWIRDFYNDGASISDADVSGGYGIERIPQPVAVWDSVVFGV
jgi:hypothetical protein